MYDGKRLLAIITARGGSKGIPRKNIKMISNKPLIGWTIEAAKKSKYIDRVMVSTEDEEIRDISVIYGAEVPFLRPKELAMDDTPSNDPVLHTIYTLIKTEKSEYNYVVLLQPTSPLRNEKHIDKAIEDLLNNSKKFDALVSVTELEHPVYWNRKIMTDGKIEKFVEYDKNKNYRRQNFDKLYRLNGAIYIVDIATFIKYNSFEPNNTMAFIMDRKASTDIDCIDDFEIAELLMSNI